MKLSTRVVKTPFVSALLFAILSSQLFAAPEMYNAAFNVTCEDALKYRDGELFLQFDAVSKAYKSDAEKQQRIEATIKEMRDHIAKAVKAVKAAQGDVNEQLKRAGFNLATLGLSYYAQNGALKAKALPNLTKIEDAAIDGVIDRTRSLSTIVVDANYTGTVDMTAVAMLPASTLQSVLLSSKANAFLIAPSVAAELIQYGYEHMALKSALEAEEKMKANYEMALRALLEKSLKNELIRLNAQKKNIEDVCLT